MVRLATRKTNLANTVCRYRGRSGVVSRICSEYFRIRRALRRDPGRFGAFSGLASLERLPRLTAERIGWRRQIAGTMAIRAKLLSS